MKLTNKLSKFFLSLGLIACMGASNVSFATETDSETQLATYETIVPTQDDKIIIPDKYNTGCSDDLIDFSKLTDDEKLKLTGGLQIGVSAGYVINLSKEKEDKTYIIENIDFSKESYFGYNHETAYNTNIIFNNCKFSSLRTGGKVNTTLNNCSIVGTANVRDITFNKCQFGHTYSDGIRPFDNCTLNDCYFTDFQYYLGEGEQHIDGVQVFGNQPNTKAGEVDGPDTSNIHFFNCRFEIPCYYVGDNNKAGMNDCIFVQNEFSNLYDVSFENIITNGSGYQFSAHAGKKKYDKTSSYEIDNISLKNCRMGEGSILGTMTAVDHNVELTNITLSPTLYVGTSWKDSKGTHFSVTNDSLKERSLTIVTDKGVYPFTIPAYHDPKVTMKADNKLTYKDYPIDLDICVDAEKYAVCYDTTIEPIQIRHVNYTNDSVKIDPTVLKPYYPGIIEIDSGSCGKSATYKLTNDGTLTISGTGAMTNYHSQLAPPWKDKYVRKVIIEEGITTVGSQAFNGRNSITELSVPSTLEIIGGRTFAGCTSISYIEIPAGFKEIGTDGFYNCPLLRIKYLGKDWNDVKGGEPYEWQVIKDNPIPEPPITPPTSAGIYIAKMDKDEIIAGLVTDAEDKSGLEFAWYATENDGETWFTISDWTLGNEWLHWVPDKFGDYIIVGKVRVKNDDATTLQAGTNVSFHPHIKGKCQMPYDGPGGGYLIGVETYDNPNQSYKYEMLILDCTLLAQGKDAWTYTTGKCSVSEGNALWTIWQPQYGYYWTLFRVFDKDENLIDQECYGFVNAY